jgi:hypothetical protein
LFYEGFIPVRLVKDTRGSDILQLDDTSYRYL